MSPAHHRRGVSRTVLATCLAAALAAAAGGCTSLGTSGPSTGAVQRAGAASYADAPIRVVELDDSAVERTAARAQARRFSEVFGPSAPVGTIIGNGDALDIAVWEAPPSVLFGSTAPGGDTALATARSAAIPQQMVGEDGAISVPFIGRLSVAGQTPAQVERAIVRRLAGRAHDPQAVVRVVGNDTRAATILGEVGASRRLSLSPRGERLLDAIASAGGPRQPVGKTTVQLSRQGTIADMPLDAIIRDPAQNLVLRPDDVVSVLFQPFSFVALGSLNKSAEIPFEGGGLTLAQALARAGGLRDDRADVRGVFVFRLEDPAALDPAVSADARRTREGRVPVIYRLNLGEGAAYFTARNFAIRDGDVLYVSTAPGVELQKFIGLISSAAFSVIGISNAAQ